MIKIVSLEERSWDVKLTSSSDESKIGAYESSILRDLLDDNWYVKDFKMHSTDHSTIWTFILERDY